MGNPLACAVACESINLLTREDDTGEMWFRGRTRKLERWLNNGLEGLRGKEGVEDVRVRGGIGVVQMKEGLDSAEVTKRCPELGAWLRPFGKLLYTMPCYVSEEEDVQIISKAMGSIVEEFG